MGKARMGLEQGSGTGAAGLVGWPVSLYGWALLWLSWGERGLLDGVLWG